MFENLDVFKTSHAMARHAGMRHALVARNMANADTPRYQPKDMSAFQAGADASSGMKATRPRHLHASQMGHGSVVVTKEGAVLSPNGNGVSVEEEMLRAVDVKRQHDRALAIYRHSLTVLRSSLGRK